MALISNKTMLYGGFALAAILLLWIAKKGVGGVASDVGEAAVNLATGAAGGVIVGVGKAVGIPATNHSQCQIDMANGDNWAASKSCDATTFLKWQKAGIGYNLDSLKNLL